MEVTYKVHREDPENGGESSFSTYQVDLPEDATVLDGLQKIRDEQDDTLAFRASCCQGTCGECAVRINWRAQFTCTTKIADVTKKGPEILCAPVRNIPVIKDLVFDMDKFTWDKMAAMRPWMEPEDEFAPTENLIPESEMADVRKTMSCYQCGLCDEGCAVLPVDFDFLGPGAMVKGYRFVMDPRETGARKEERLAVVEQPKGLWDCVHCYEANGKCARGLEPSSKIMEMRDVSFKHGIKNEKVARHHNSFINSVKQTGWLDERKLVMETEGLTNIGGLMKLVPTAVRAMTRGKMPGRHEKRPGADQIKRIIEKAEESK